MAITAPIAGAYTGVHNSNALNYTRQGYILALIQKGERIEESDLYGLSLIEIIYRGAQATLETECMIYSTAQTGALYPWVTTFGNVYTAALPIARLASSVAAALVLTAVAATPAALSPATLTAAKTIISPDQNFQIIFNSAHRRVPLRFDILTTDTAGTGSLFSVT